MRISSGKIINMGYSFETWFRCFRSLLVTILGQIGREPRRGGKLTLWKLIQPCTIPIQAPSFHVITILTITHRVKMTNERRVSRVLTNKRLLPRHHNVITITQRVKQVGSYSLRIGRKKGVLSRKKAKITFFTYICSENNLKPPKILRTFLRMKSSGLDESDVRV